MRSIGSGAVLLVLASWPSPSAAQTAAAQGQSTADPTISATVQTLVRTIESQQQLLEEQGRLLEQLRREMAELRALVPPVPNTGATGVQPPAPPPAPAPIAAGGQPPPIEQIPERRPELPPDVVSAGDFPGSFKIPGSDAALKIGGMVRATWVSTFDPLNVQDRFETSAIPVGGGTAASDGGSVDVIATPSRFNFDLRTPTGVGYMRAFIEGDFGGAKGTLRLRHAYGQWRRLIFGQTWSTFADPEAEPDGIDFEGLNAIVRFRQAQVRWSFPLSERVRMALALEDPDPDLTGATGVNQVPDAVARVRWEPRPGGHVQVSGLVRQLRGEPAGTTDVAAAGGYGASVSGRVPFALWNKRDQVLFQVNGGSGIGRYISDLRSLGGQDGVFDPVANELLPLVVFSGLVGYEHWWSDRLRSSLSVAAVGVENRAAQSDAALHRTRQGTVNFMWSPIPRLDLVTEFLWGRRENKNGGHSFAAQTQIGSTFRF
jgi:hypothetical protein